MVEPDPTAKPSAVRVVSAEDLFREHAAFVADFLVHLGVRHQEIDDLVQETFVVVHRKGGYVPGVAQPRTWLAHIAMRVASTHRRSLRRRREDVNDDLTELPAATPTQEDAVSSSQWRALVLRALREIDVEKRSLIILFEIQGEPCDSIAASLGVRVNTVYSRLHAARAAFKRAFERLESELSPSDPAYERRTR